MYSDRGKSNIDIHIDILLFYLIYYKLPEIIHTIMYPIRDIKTKFIWRKLLRNFTWGSQGLCLLDNI